MEYLKVTAVSLFSLIALFILTKLTGNKQMSQLTMFDYVIGISIGSIAAEMATDLENPMRSLLAMAIYALVAYLISVCTSKSLKLRRMVLGRSHILMENGKLYRKNLKRAHLDLNEFLTQCRIAGYFDLSAINTAVFEPNGKISFLPFPDKRPVTAQDLKTVPVSDEICFNVIMDGEILKENLRSAGYDTAWLKNEMNAQGVKKAEEVFLAILDRQGTLKIFKNNNEEQKHDYFE